MIPIDIPNRPNVPESTNKGNLNIRSGRLKLYRGMINDEIPAVATTITIGAEMIPARTAASPMTNAPTTLTRGP
ncbi:MAG: hypothetical protein K0Q73_8391, partial [Paenibacillus sp.]|nr:hypothetical protein [Paenibacillus sp.]